MYETSRYLVLRAILEENPNISEKALKQKLFLAFYGNDFDMKTKEKIIKHFEQL